MARRTLAEHVAAEGPMPAKAAARLIRAVAVDLAILHETHGVHRDVNPSQIVIDDNESDLEA